MKNILKLSLVSFASLTLAAGCIQETFPQTSYVTTTQAQVPGAIDRFVDAITATLCGFPNYGGGTDANDFGYPRFYIAWDSMQLVHDPRSRRNHRELPVCLDDPLWTHQGLQRRSRFRGC